MRVSSVIVLLCLGGCASDSTESASSPDVAATDSVATDGVTADSNTVDTTTDGSSADPDTPVDARPPRICRAGAPWSAGTKAFTDVTLATGIDALGLAPYRLSAADFDGDGNVDLSARGHAPGERDDFSDGGVRRTWLLRGDGALGFTDVTESSGFSATRDGAGGRTAHVVIFGDVDNDGDLDAFSGVNVADATKDTGDRNEILLNDGAGNFTLAQPGPLQNGGALEPTTSAAFVDVDRDGALDLFLGQDTAGGDRFSDRLWIGDGAAGWTDGSAAAGLTTQDWVLLGAINSAKAHRPTWGVSACDINDDGNPDLLTSSYSRYFNGMWLSDGAGGFVDAALTSGMGNDGRNEWQTNLNAQCYCELEPDAADCDGVPAPPDYFTCTDPNALRWNHQFDREPFRLGGNTFATICGDVDNDGDLDVMHAEIVHWDVGTSSDPTELIINDGSSATPTFSRPGNVALGLERDWKRVDWNAGDIGVAFLDFDNDGRLDIYIASSDYPGTRGFLYHQRADDFGFEEVAVTDGINQPRSLGIAIADFDNDGDVDLITGHGRSRCSGDPTCYPTREVHAFRNELGADTNSIRIRLVGGPDTNRSAIGARVRLTAGGVTQTRVVDGGHGHYGMQNTLDVTFGLGSACDIDTIEVRWPDGGNTLEQFDDVRANYRVTITQGQGLAYTL
ncbi:MAG: hypothetical protein ACI9OJ_001391 [Myxococcota bacterium]|jgi:hypothetical protein